MNKYKFLQVKILYLILYLFCEKLTIVFLQKHVKIAVYKEFFRKFFTNICIFFFIVALYRGVALACIIIELSEI